MGHGVRAMTQMPLPPAPSPLLPALRPWVRCVQASLPAGSGAAQVPRLSLAPGAGYAWLTLPVQLLLGPHACLLRPAPRQKAEGQRWLQTTPDVQLCTRGTRASVQSRPWLRYYDDPCNIQHGAGPDEWVHVPCSCCCSAALLLHL